MGRKTLNFNWTDQTPEVIAYIKEHHHKDLVCPLCGCWGMWNAIDPFDDDGNGDLVECRNKDCQNEYTRTGNRVLVVHHLIEIEEG